MFIFIIVSVTRVNQSLCQLVPSHKIFSRRSCQSARCEVKDSSVQIKLKCKVLDEAYTIIFDGITLLKE